MRREFVVVPQRNDEDKIEKREQDNTEDDDGTTMMRRRFVVLARCSKKSSSILLTRRGRNENTITTCNAWNNDDHEFYGTGADEEENTGSLDEGDTFEGEQYLRRANRCERKRYNTRKRTENRRTFYRLYCFQSPNRSFLDKEKYYTCTSRGL